MITTTLRSSVDQVGKKVEDLNKELEIFRAAFNRRVQYFAAYQIVSDSVCPANIPMEQTNNQVTAPISLHLEADIQEADREILALETQIARCQVKGRYLKHLGEKENQGTDQEMRDDCIICLGSSEDDSGILLSCGHFFCVVSPFVPICD